MHIALTFRCFSALLSVAHLLNYLKMDSHLPQTAITDDYSSSAVREITLSALQFNLDKKSTSRSKRLVGVEELQRAILELGQVRVLGPDDRNPALEDLNLRFMGTLRPVKEAEHEEEEPKLPLDERPKREIEKGKTGPKQDQSPLQRTSKDQESSEPHPAPAASKPPLQKELQLEAAPQQKLTATQPADSKLTVTPPKLPNAAMPALVASQPAPHMQDQADSGSDSEELDPAKLSIERQTTVEVRAEYDHKDIKTVAKSELVLAEIKEIQTLEQERARQVAEALEAEKAALALREASALEALQLSKAREEAVALEKAKALEAARSLQESTAKALETAQLLEDTKSQEEAKSTGIRALGQALVLNAQAESNLTLEETAKFPCQSSDYTLVGTEGCDGASIMLDTASEAMTKHQFPADKQHFPSEKTVSGDARVENHAPPFKQAEQESSPDLSALTDAWMDTRSGALRPMGSLSPIRKRQRPNRLLVNPILRHMSGRNTALAPLQSSMQPSMQHMSRDLSSPNEVRKPTTHLSLPPIFTTEVSRAFSQASYLPRSQKAGALYPTKYAAAHINYDLDLLVKPFSPFKCTKLVVEGTYRAIRRSMGSRGTGRDSSRPSDLVSEATLRSESQSPDPPNVTKRTQRKRSMHR